MRVAASVTMEFVTMRDVQSVESGKISENVLGAEQLEKKDFFIQFHIGTFWSKLNFRFVEFRQFAWNPRSTLSYRKEYSKWSINSNNCLKNDKRFRETLFAGHHLRYNSIRTLQIKDLSTLPSSQQVWEPVLVFKTRLPDNLRSN